MDPRRTAEVTGIAERAIRQAAQWWGTAKTSFLMHARGIEHHSHGVQNVLGSINMVLASGRIGRPGCGYATITGQGNGQGGREHGQKCDLLPGARDIENPEHRAHVAGVWGIDVDEMPHKGVDCYELLRKVETGEIRGLLSISFNPIVSLPDSNFVKRMLEKLEFYVNIDFFMSETARFADVVLPGSQHEEDEGVSCSAEGRVIKINKAIEPPGDAKQDWKIIQDIARSLGASGASRSAVRLRSSKSCDAPPRAAWPTTPALLMTRSIKIWASSGPAQPRDLMAGPSIMPARRGCSKRDRGIQSQRERDRSISPTAKRASTRPPTRLPRKKPTRNTRSC